MESRGAKILRLSLAKSKSLSNSQNQRPSQRTKLDAIRSDVNLHESVSGTAVQSQSVFTGRTSSSGNQAVGDASVNSSKKDGGAPKFSQADAIWSDALWSDGQHRESLLKNDSVRGGGTPSSSTRRGEARGGAPGGESLRKDGIQRISDGGGGTDSARVKGVLRGGQSFTQDYEFGPLATSGVASSKPRRESQITQESLFGKSVRKNKSLKLDRCALWVASTVNELRNTAPRHPPSVVKAPSIDPPCVIDPSVVRDLYSSLCTVAESVHLNSSQSLRRPARRQETSIVESIAEETSIVESIAEEKSIVESIVEEKSIVESIVEEASVVKEPYMNLVNSDLWVHSQISQSKKLNKTATRTVWRKKDPPSLALLKEKKRKRNRKRCSDDDDEDYDDYKERNILRGKKRKLFELRPSKFVPPSCSESDDGSQDIPLSCGFLNGVGVTKRRSLLEKRPVLGSPSEQPPIIGSTSEQPPVFGSPSEPRAIIGFPSEQPRVIESPSEQLLVLGSLSEQPRVIESPSEPRPVMGSSSEQPPVIGSPSEPRPIIGFPSEQPCVIESSSEQLLVLGSLSEQSPVNGSPSEPRPVLGSPSEQSPVIEPLSEQTSVVPYLSRDIDTRPSRPCPMCKKFFKRLTPHLKAVHKNEEIVKKALTTSGKGSIKIFQALRRAGILAYNIDVMGRKGATLLAEKRVRRKKVKDATLTEHTTLRRGENIYSSLLAERKDGVVCDQCSGIFARRQYFMHKKRCSAEVTCVPQPIPLYAFQQNADLNDQFTRDIVAGFINDEVGQLCRSDPHIQAIGRRLYEKMQAKQDKKTEVKKSVRSDMRRLATLFLNFRMAGRETQLKDGNSMPIDFEFVDMFNRINFKCLESAIKDGTTRSDETMKAGLKIAIFYLVKKAAKIVKASYLVKKDDAAAAEVGMFVEVLNMNYNFLFGDALYNLNTTRNVKLRKPAQLPLQSDVQALQLYTVSRMKAMTDDSFTYWSGHEFAELRDLAVSRITLFNGRRSGEPARLKLTAWEDTCNNVWIPVERIEQMDEVQQELLSKSKLMYLTGKGLHFVPVLVPLDTVDALMRISDVVIRKQCGIRDNNEYLFPSTQQSFEHLSGWHAIKRVCKDAKIDDKNITATKMRHYISTLYACLEMPEAKRGYFLKHIGHSAFINENVYQVPLAEAEVFQVGNILHQFDDNAIPTVASDSRSSATQASVSQSSASQASASQASASRSSASQASASRSSASQSSASCPSASQASASRSSASQASASCPSASQSSVSHSSASQASASRSMIRPSSSSSHVPAIIAGVSASHQTDRSSIVANMIATLIARASADNPTDNPTMINDMISELMAQANVSSTVHPTLVFASPKSEPSAASSNEPSATSTNELSAAQNNESSANPNDESSTNPNDESSANQNDELLEIRSGQRKRMFTRWNPIETKSVVTYFHRWISSDDTGIPNKKAILEFKALHSDISFTWQTIRTKVVNERMACSKRRKACIEKMKPWSGVVGGEGSQRRD